MDVEYRCKYVSGFFILVMIILVTVLVFLYFYSIFLRWTILSIFGFWWMCLYYDYFEDGYPIGDGNYLEFVLTLSKYFVHWYNVQTSSTYTYCRVLLVCLNLIKTKFTTKTPKSVIDSMRIFVLFCFVWFLWC